MAFFVDLRATFDSEDRGILVKTIKERGIREGLVRRVAELLREIKSRMRVGELTGKIFEQREMQGRNAPPLESPTL